MYFFAHLLLILSFLSFLICIGVILTQLMLQKSSFLRWIESIHYIATLCITVTIIILLYAFTTFDFSLEYVAQYSDKTLPLFYRITALWAGQAGSLLFWAWSVAIFGVIFNAFSVYTRLSDETKLWYWVFYFAIMAFFLLLLTAWSNPFVVLPNPPIDGMGLNPMLQNPGMIFHPPLLFLGYGGFVVPGCLALAQTLSGKLNCTSPICSKQPWVEQPWYEASRVFIMTAWLLLTAGIILGAWWAYMELGWGGYWAWDPVENASLIPWLVATAYLHTGIIEEQRSKLTRLNVFLMALTTISAFFATYLVRSGVIQSLHAYPDGGVGKPLLIFVLFSLFLAIIIPAFSKEKTPPVVSLTNKEGILSFVAWFLLALSFIILIATMWPVIIAGVLAISHILPESIQASLPQKPMGLEPPFYNRTCLPLFAALTSLLIVCPFRQWKKGWSNIQYFFVALMAGGIAIGFSYSIQVTNPIVLASIGATCGAIVGLITLFIMRPSLFSIPQTIAAHGVHLGVLMMALGVAFSGPSQTTHELVFNKTDNKAHTIQGFAQSNSFLPLTGSYSFELQEIYEGQSRHQVENVPHYQFLKASVRVWKNNTYLGVIEPQIRIYSSNPNQSFREVETIFSLGNEVYATFSHFDDKEQAHLQININPLVNWLWIGGIVMSILPLFGLRPRKKKNKNIMLEGI